MAALAAVVALGLAVALLPDDFFQRVVLANEPSGLACDELPATEDLARLVDREAALIETIEQEMAGLVSIGIDEERCPGRAEIVVHHTGSKQKDRVRQLLQGSPLDGTPIRWVNV